MHQFFSCCRRLSTFARVILFSSAISFNSFCNEDENPFCDPSQIYLSLQPNPFHVHPIIAFCVVSSAFQTASRILKSPTPDHTAFSHFLSFFRSKLQELNHFMAKTKWWMDAERKIREIFFRVNHQKRRGRILWKAVENWLTDGTRQRTLKATYPNLLWLFEIFPFIVPRKISIHCFRHLKLRSFESQWGGMMKVGLCYMPSLIAKIEKELRHWSEASTATNSWDEWWSK